MGKRQGQLVEPVGMKHHSQLMVCQLSMRLSVPVAVVTQLECERRRSNQQTGVCALDLSHGPGDIIILRIQSGWQPAAQPSLQALGQGQ